VIFFRNYVGMSATDKALYRDTLALVFRARGEDGE